MGSNETSLLLVMTIIMFRKRVKLNVKATFHSMIFDIPIHPVHAGTDDVLPVKKGSQLP